MNREIHTISGFALDREGQPAPTLSVQIGSLAGFSKDDGSWSRRVYAGDVTLELRGGGLPGPVTVSVAVNRDIRLDVIGGDTLLTDASITAVGPFERVERIGLLTKSRKPRRNSRTAHRPARSSIPAAIQRLPD